MNLDLKATLDHLGLQAEAMIDDVYEIFRRRVREGRGLTPEATHKLAKGRVWTGARPVLYLARYNSEKFN